MSQVAKKSEEQRLAEAEVEKFRRDLGPFVVAAETTRMPMLFTDAKDSGNPIIFANDSLLALTGYEREELLGQDFAFLLAATAVPESLAQMQARLERGHDGASDDPYCHKDGSSFWAATFISPVRDKSGEVVQNFVSLVDHTRHKHEQAHSRMLIEELNHRVKNTLATVQAIARQALRTGADLETIRESIESRLFALARSHDLLSKENWTDIGLLDLVNAALEPFRGVDSRAERFSVVGENIRLRPKSTLALGIAFHELATNAMKHGALSNETGTIRIDWSIEPTRQGNRLILRWQEKHGPLVTPPSHRGFGSQVIERGLAHELQGTVQLDFASEGVACTINVPAP